jgi:pimeloyl-ACP methyl ester carboxylesterase
MYGPNRTAAQYSVDPGYPAAYNDVQGALAWAQKEGYKTIVAWGSSYSACLVLRLASERPRELKAVISFSPGEYFDDKGVVARWAHGVTVPVLAVCTSQENAVVDEILKARSAGAAARDLRSGPDAIHGSSTLRPDKNHDGAEHYWGYVEKFLKPYAEPPKA